MSGTGITLPNEYGVSFAMYGAPTARSRTMNTRFVPRRSVGSCISGDAVANDDPPLRSGDNERVTQLVDNTPPPNGTHAWNCPGVASANPPDSFCSPVTGARPSEPDGVPATLEIGAPEGLRSLDRSMAGLAWMGSFSSAWADRAVARPSSAAMPRAKASGDVRAGNRGEG